MPAWNEFILTVNSTEQNVNILETLNLSQMLIPDSFFLSQSNFIGFPELNSAF